MSEELTFEEFNCHIDESHDDGCSMCFSFHHYAHLDQATRKVAWLGFVGKQEEYLLILAEELETRNSLPIDDNIYFLIVGAELCDISDLDLRDRIMIHLIHRAYEMIEKKMSNAWVGVRAYAWMKGMDPLLLISFLADTDDLTVWQVILGNMNYDIPHNEKVINEHSLSLRTMRNMVYDYTKKALAMGNEIKPYVVAVNGIKGLAALQDSRVIELMDQLPRHTLDRTIKESCEHQIKYLTKIDDVGFVPVLEQLMQRCQNKL